MTAALGTAPATASTPVSPTGRSLWRSARGPVAIGAVLLLVVGLVAYVEGGGQGTLDIDSYSHGGSHAVAALLRDQGVPVRQVRTVAAAAATSGGTLVVVAPDLLTPDAARRVAGSRARTVVVVGATGDDVVDAFAADTRVLRTVDTSVRQPGCTLVAAVSAGAVDAGGAVYAPGPAARPTGAAAASTQVDSCYAVGGDPSVVALTTPARQVVLLGSSDPLVNGRIARQGNAALALDLLGANRGDPAGVTWYLPSLTDLYAPADRPGGRPTLTSLLPHSVRAGLWWLVVVVLLLVAWRVRRLGALVPEPLPVVVRASESVEGRARLYRRGRTRDRAADLLRAATRDRLVGALGLPQAADRDTVVEAVASRCERTSAEVATLLYGAAPPDDASLVRLASGLDDLTRTVLDRPEDRRP